MNEKEKLEEAACKYFLDSYNRLNGTNFVIAEHRDRPDFLVADREKDSRLGVEITHLFYGSEEAKHLLGRSDKDLTGPVTAEGIIENLNGLLADKIKQADKYNFDDPVILVVRVASPVFNKNTFEMFEAQISLPPQDAYREVWILAHDELGGAWKGLKRLGKV